MQQRKLNTEATITDKIRQPLHNAASQESIRAGDNDCRERAQSQLTINASEADEEYTFLPPKPTTLHELTEELAPYLPPGSDRKSAFFKVTSRAKNDEIAKLHRRG